MSHLEHRIASLSPTQREQFLAHLRKLRVETAGPIPHRPPGGGAAPLSFEQEALWFIEQVTPGSTTYSEPVLLRLEGPLSVAALAHSIQQLVDRHASLRTRFSAEDGRPVQVIAPTLQIALEEIDLSSLPADEREPCAWQQMVIATTRPFDLAQGPLLRTTLFRLGEGEHLLLVLLHHIIFDDWSHTVLLRDLTTLYAAAVTGDTAPLPDLPIQAADYAVWQRETVPGAHEERLLAYWKRQLAGAPELLELPTDHPRPPIQTSHGASHHFRLSATVAERLQQLSQQEGATLFMTGLAAFAAFLARYTGQEDIVVGSPIANRTRPETEGLISLLLNMLALRTDLSGNPTFRALLQRVRENTLAAFANAEVPFARVVEAVQPERSLSHLPLFQVSYALDYAAPSSWSVAGGTWHLMIPASTVAKFDLRLVLTKDEASLRGVMEYMTDLFEAATIARMVGHFCTFLEGIAADPDQPVATIPLLTAAERQQLLVEWTATSVPYPKHEPIHRLFEAQVARAPERVALICEGATLTYQALNQRANQLAHVLRKLGVGPETRVGLCLERSFELVVALLGILKAGGGYVPLDPTYPKERLAFMLEDTQAPVVLTEQACLDALPVQGRHVLCLDRDWPLLHEEVPENLEGGATAENLAYVIYTSGSTGQPKGVEIRHYSIARLVMGVTYADLDATKTLLHLSPIAFDAATFEIWGALLHGARCVLYRERIPTPRGIGDAISLHQVTTVWLTASLFNTVIDEAPEALRNARQVITGGEALSVAHVRRALELLPATQIINGYGPTEGTTFTCCNPVPRPLDEHLRSIPIGYPIANTLVRILDIHLCPMPIGVPGELYIGGDGLARGYLNRPELTAERFIADPFADGADTRLYRTGDRARWLPDGKIDFLGRFDDQIKIRGFRIEPGEVEAPLLQHPLVAECLVLAVDASPGEKRLVAYIAPALRAQAPTPEALSSYLAGRLPNYMVPAAFVCLERFPVTSVGKVDRRALPTPVWGERSSEAEAPGTDTERWLAAIWCDLLLLDHVNRQDNFFLLGGSSLQATRLVARLSNRLGTAVPIQWIFQYPTLAALAATIDQAVPLARGQQGVEPGLEKHLGRRHAGEEDTSRIDHPGEVERGAATWATRPLLSLILTGLQPPVDAVALTYLSRDDFPMENRDEIRNLFEGLPELTNLLECSLGRIGVITLPLFGSDLYLDQAHLVRLCRQARELTRAIGGRVLALTGLLPSATDYGQAILDGEGPHPVAITTGHAAVVAAVISAITRTLEAAGRDLREERVAFLGLGSIGTAALRLLLSALPHPAALLLCDLGARRAALEALGQEVTGELGFAGSLCLLEADGLSLPEAVYSTTLIVGATNVPDVVDISRVRPGTLIIDDSGPHCFEVARAIERFQVQGDILFTEGGALLPPEPIRETVYAPDKRVHAAQDATRLRVSHYHEYLMGCVLSGLLAAREEDLAPTIGLVSNKASRLHLKRLQELGFQAAPLHCEGYRLPDEMIASFRRRFGRQDASATATQRRSHVY